MSTTPTEMLARLVAFATVSRDSNLALIEFVREYLQGHGVQCTVLPDPTGAKANLYATVGPPSPGGVVLSGHTDVVPVDGQPWSTDPFTVAERNGRLYGRGTADMKGFIAVALALVPRMLARGLARPVHLALSYDEEVGCLGAPAMIERLRRALPAPAAVIVGEPTDMRPANAHKGIVGRETLVTGHEAHSAHTHRGVSAVMTAARLIACIDEMAAQARERPSPQPFEPPYTTLHVGVVHGGTALNIVSRECRFVWDVRATPEDPPGPYLERFGAYCARLAPAMQAVAPNAGIATRAICDVPGLAPDPDGEAEALVRRLTGHNGADALAFGTEAGQFQRAGFSAVICGPGSIKQAHQPDEYIERDQLDACEAFVDRLLDHLAA